MAQVDRRTVSNQVAYLMEKGLLVLERQQAQVKAGKSA
jgi:hypothetical protein